MKGLCSLFLLISPLIVFAQDNFDTLLYQSTIAVYFETDSFLLKEHHLASLDSFLLGSDKEQIAFSIEGHTDDIGSNTYNDELSDQRAQSIISYLIEKGVADNRVTSKHHGELKPVASNDSETGRSQNRRATVQKYQVKEMQWVSGIVQDSVTLKGIEANIKLHSKTIQSETKTDSTGFFRIAGPANEVVGLDVRAKGYLLHSKMLKVKPLMATKPIPLLVSKIEIGRSMNFDKLFFEGNKDVLLEKSSPVLKEIQFFMSENGGVCIEIGGHINLPNMKPSSADSWNYYLSVARAKKIHDKLNESHVNTERMVYKGFGNWKMVYPKATSEYEMAKNRRVELKIIDCENAKTSNNDTLPEALDFSTGIRVLLKTEIN